MKIYIAIILILCSCSFLRKAKTTDYHNAEETTVSKQDSLTVVHKDSTYTNTRTEEEVNTTTIEFETGDTLQDLDPLIVKVPINAADYFNIPIQQKVKKITYTTTKKLDVLEGGKLTMESLSQGSRTDSTSKETTTAAIKETKSRCGMPVWAFVVIGLSAFILWKLWPIGKDFVNLISAFRI